MADYDVAALALVVPATSGPKTSYRPAVSVRNNGIHDALASGYLRIYAAGLLVFQTELYSATIPAGATGTAQAIDFWVPTEEGTYTIHAYLSCPLDQVETNNMLGPVSIEITSAPVPPSPIVEPHAPQHEEDGTDEISIDGLKGRAADPQAALAHASSHQVGGTDALNVGSLQGILAQDQPAQVHSNTRHNPAMATEAGLDAHENAIAVHTAATNLANRETTGPDIGLLPFSQLATGSEIGGTDLTRFLARDRIFRKLPSLGTTSGPVLITEGAGSVPLITIPVPARWLSQETVIIFESNCAINAHASQDPTISLRLLQGIVQLLPLDFITPLTALIPVKIRASIIGTINSSIMATLEIRAEGAPPSPAVLFSFTQVIPIALVDTSFTIDASVASGIPGDSLQQYSAFARALHQPA